MKKTTTILAAVIIAAGSLNAKVYSFKEFSADFPSQPEVKRIPDEGGKQPYTMYYSYNNRIAFGIAQYDDSGYNYSLEKIKAFSMKGASEDAIAIIKTKEFDIQGYPALLVLMKTRANNGQPCLTTQVDIYAYPARYLIVINDYTEKDSGSYYRTMAFLDSFLLKNDAPAGHRAMLTNTAETAPQEATATASAPTAPNDCLVVATEIYGRLKTSAHWVRIISFRWTTDGQARTGHATVLYQPTPTSNVFIYDKAVGGSLDLETHSHELAELVASLRSAANGKITIEDPAWVN